MGFAHCLRHRWCSMFPGDLNKWRQKLQLWGNHFVKFLQKQRNCRLGDCEGGNFVLAWLMTQVFTKDCQRHNSAQSPLQPYHTVLSKDVHPTIVQHYTATSLATNPHVLRLLLHDSSPNSHLPLRISPYFNIFNTFQHTPDTGQHEVPNYKFLLFLNKPVILRILLNMLFRLPRQKN